MGEPSTPPPSAASAIRPSLISPIARRARSLGPVAEMSVQQIEDARRTSVARVLDVWSKLEERYAVPLEDDDVVDIATGRIIQDRGVLRGLSTRIFGGQADNGAETDADEDADDDDADCESEDELGRWPGDEQRKVDQRLQWLRDSNEPSLLDQQELASFLRAEQQRKRVEGDLDADVFGTTTNHRSSATDDDDGNDNDNDLDAPLPQIVESGDEDLVTNGTDTDDESEDELLLTDEVEPRPPASPTPTPSPSKNRARLQTPAQLYTPPRSQSIDSPVLRARSSAKTITSHSTPPSASRDRAETPKSKNPSRRSYMTMEVVVPKRIRGLSETPQRTQSSAESTSKSQNTMASTAKRRDDSVRSTQPFPSPSPSTSVEIPLIDFNEIKRGRGTPRKTPAPERTPCPSRMPDSSSTQHKTPSSSRRSSIDSLTSSPLKGKGKAKASNMFMTPDDETDEQSVAFSSPVRTAVSSPRKRKRLSPSGSDDDLGASPTKRRPSHAPSTPSVVHPPAPPWPIAGPSTLSYSASSTAPQQAFMAQFLSEVQRMNMLAQAILPNFWASSSAPPLPAPPAVVQPERSQSRHPRRSHSADELEPEYEPVTPQKQRSRSALRTPGSARSSVRKRVTFWLRREDDESDEEQRGRIRARVRGTPAPGRSPAQ